MVKQSVSTAKAARDFSRSLLLLLFPGAPFRLFNPAAAAAATGTGRAPAAPEPEPELLTSASPAASATQQALCTNNRSSTDACWPLSSALSKSVLSLSRRSSDTITGHSLARRERARVREGERERGSEGGKLELH